MTGLNRSEPKLNTVSKTNSNQTTKAPKQGDQTMRFTNPKSKTTRRLMAVAAALAIGLAACGSDDQESAAPTDAADVAVTQDDAAPSETPTDVPTPVDVLAGDSALGPILVGPNGLSLYGFTNDVDAISACYGTCADAWPPVIVSDDWTAGPGLDFGIFATTVREDGQRQLVAGKWPLYYFAGDAAPGDIQGQGSGDVWFVVDLNGGLITDDAPADGETDSGTDEEATPADQGPGPVTTATTELGDTLVDSEGLTLYGFLPDREAGGPSCNDACADAWPPVLVDSNQLPAGLDPAIFSVMTRDDGTWQLAAGIWPLYRFAGDAAPGDINGQGSGDNWFAAAPDGKLIGVPGAANDEEAQGSVSVDGSDGGSVSVDGNDGGSVDVDGDNASVDVDGDNASVDVDTGDDTGGDGY